MEKSIKILGYLFAVLLLFISGIYFGGRSYYRYNKLKDKKNLIDIIGYEITQVPTTVRKLMSGENEIVSIWRGELPKVPDNPEAMYVGEESIPVDKSYLYSVYDYKTDSIHIKLHKLNENKTIKKWSLHYDDIKVKWKEWRNKYDDRYAISFTEGQYGPFLKASAVAPRILGTNKVVCNFPVSGLFCINQKNEIEWVTRPVSHHSVEVDSNKNTYICSWVEGEKDYREDAIVKVDSNGKVIYSKSVYEIALSNKEMGIHNLKPEIEGEQDPFHLNDVQPITKDSKLGFWKKGDLLLSLRNVNTVMLYRPSNDSLLWYRQHPWLRQHDVSIVNDSVISVFDNHVWTIKPNKKIQEHSNTVFYDFSKDSAYTPFTKIYDKYNAKTHTQGRSQYFEKDSLLFTEISDKGFALIHNERKDTTFQLYLNSYKSNRANHLRWTKLYK